MIDRYNEEEVLGFIEGELTHEQKVEFEKKLVEDPRLRNLVAHLVLDRHRLRNLPDEAAPPTVMDAVNQAVERHMLLGSTPGAPPAQVRLRFTRWAAYGGIAAMIAVVATIVFQTLYNPGVMNLAVRSKGSMRADATHGSRGADGGLKTSPLASAEKKNESETALESEAAPPPIPPRSLGEVAGAKAGGIHADPSWLDESIRRREAIAGRQTPAPEAAKPAESPLAMKTDTDASKDQKQGDAKTEAISADSLAKALDAETRARKLLDRTNTPASPAASGGEVAKTAAPGSKATATEQNRNGSDARQSDVELVVTSASPLDVADQVREWAKLNQAEVVGDSVDLDSAPAVNKEKIEAQAEERLPERRRMVLILSRGQVAQLADVLTRKQANHVLVMAPTQPSGAVAPRVGAEKPATDVHVNEGTDAPASQPAGNITGRDTGAAATQARVGEQDSYRYQESDRVVLPILIRAPQEMSNTPLPTATTPAADPAKK